MARSLPSALLAGLFLAALAPAAEKPYEPTWESLKKHQEAPEWFRDAKFGIYTHWGPCTQANSMVPSGASGWYGRQMYKKGSKTYRAHKKHLGPPSKFGYHDFIPKFTAGKFDADRWAALFKKAGARFAGPVAEHHDGFSMWDSDVTPWNATDMGPKKDIAGRLEKAIRKRGMKFVMTFHHAACGRFSTKGGQKMPWWFPKSEEMGNLEPTYRKLYGNMPAEEFYTMWKAKLIECIDKYRPDLMWFDSGLDAVPDRHKTEYLAYYFNKAEDWGKEVGVTYKQKDLPPEVGILDHERGRENRLTEYVWLTDDSGGSWFYHSPAYKGSGWVVVQLIEIVSRNGCLLLNVPPRADGTFSDQVKTCLRGVGVWLAVNGEAIYGTRPWKTCKEGDDIRFTRSKRWDAVYVICLTWPGEELRVRALAAGSALCPEDIEEVRMLGVKKELTWSRNKEALEVALPEEPPCKHAYALRVELKGGT